MTYQIIFPTLPQTNSGDSENTTREIVSKTLHLSEPPSAVRDSTSADIVQLDPPAPMEVAVADVANSAPAIKDEQALRTIGEVAQQLAQPAHVIRFWETRFPQITPSVRADGRRYYRPDDITFLQGVHRLLREEGYTIKGVHRLIKQKGIGFVRDKSEKTIAAEDVREDQILLGLVGDLEQLRTRVKKLVA